MSLQAGRRLGVFEILSPLGAGGMGEVYRARDTRLGREVAVKVLPEAFSNDPERAARFEREARMLATLNHAGIAAIHDFEEWEGTRFLVLELVEGDTLDIRLRRGPLSTEEALGVGCQIAEALEAAHEKGIIHRDLKPSNIKRTPDGRIKLLDFGLAKAFEEQSGPDASTSPTLTTPSGVSSRQGTILGTAAYMSPEQARAESLDRRTDVWSFGCVLFECLTGRRAFGAPTVAESVAAILEKEPAWDALPATAPESVRSLLRRCLRKDLGRRLHDIADARLELEEALSQLRGGPPANPRPLAVPSMTRRMATPLLAFLAGAAVAAALTAGLRHRAPLQTSFPKRMTLALEPPPSHSWDITISPDGRRLAYVAKAGSWEQIHVREMDQLESKAVPGTELGFSPFFSPDGESLGFITGGKLKVIAIRGGKDRVLAEAPGLRGASWGPDGEIVYCPALDAGLFRVSASGGVPRPLTTLDAAKGELTHCWPRILPGGRAALFTVIPQSGREEDREIAVVSLATGERRTLMKGGTYPLYSPSGHLLYGSGQQLFAAPFDADRLALTGPAVSVLEGVRVDSGRQGVAAIDVSMSGSLVYFVAPPPRELSLVWVDRRGGAESVVLSRRVSGLPALSADGKSIAAVIEGDVWIAKLSRDRWERITFDRRSSYPVWSSDGRLAFSSRQEQAGNLFWALESFWMSPRRLTQNVNLHLPTSFSPDGKLLAFTERNPLSADVGVVPLGENDRTPQFLLSDPEAVEQAARFSPDGRWLAYAFFSLKQSEIRVRPYEIRVRPYPGPGDSVLVAIEAHAPLWSRDGRELYYRKGKAVFAAPVRAGARFAVGTPTLLFEGDFEDDALLGNYDVSSDGRFLMLKTPDTPLKVVVVPDWAEELRSRLGK